MRDAMMSAAGAPGGAVSRREGSFVQRQLTAAIISARARARELLSACREPDLLDALDSTAHKMAMAAAELRMAAQAAVLADKH